MNSSPVVCPAILAINEDVYRDQMTKVAHLAERIQIDLTDGEFTASHTISPERAWWPVGINADIHLMYKQPIEAIRMLLTHKPNLIIVHAESDANIEEIAALCKPHGTKLGMALLSGTTAGVIIPAMELIDHVLIFSGSLGEYGGSADLELLGKAEYLKQMRPELEIGWDGGVNDQNVAQLVNGGIDVLNVGGYIQNAQDPQAAFETLKRIADETGTT